VIDNPSNEDTTMMPRLLITVLGLIGCVAATTQAMAERRVALVVGNAQYIHTQPLPNPRNDAQDMAASLRKLGFEVTLGYDLDQINFAHKIDEFARNLEGADVGLFFYAGHGLQINDKNYLVSTEARLESAFLVPSETIELDAIIRLMESKTGISLIFLDACRNNPLADNLKRSLAATNRSASLGRGLARVDPSGHDALVAFSAAPGQEAADGRGRNSPFAASLLRRMPQPGVEVSVMLKEVAADVREETRNAQRPQQLSDMTRTFYFAKAGPVIAPAPPAVVQSAATTDPSVDLAFWQSVSNANDCESMHAYLRRFPSGIFIELAGLSERRLCEPGKRVAANLPPRETTPATVPPPPLVRAQSAAPAGIPAPADLKTTVAAAPAPAARIPTVIVIPEVAAETVSTARSLQSELLRVGCGVGRLQADGNWNAVSREVLRSFGERTQSVVTVDRPTPEALAAVRSHQERVCPPPCDAGMEIRDGKCVPSKPLDRPRQAARTPEPPRAQHVIEHETQRADSALRSRAFAVLRRPADFVLQSERRVVDPCRH
jgi:Caspase domain